MFTEPPRDSSFTRVDYLVAVRLYFGLDVRPAIPNIAEMTLRCGNIGVHSGERCKDEHDGTGRHAFICQYGGSTIVRHTQ